MKVCSDKWLFIYRRRLGSNECPRVYSREHLRGLSSLWFLRDLHSPLRVIKTWIIDLIFSSYTLTCRQERAWVSRNPSLNCQITCICLQTHINYSFTLFFPWRLKTISGLRHVFIKTHMDIPIMHLTAEPKNVATTDQNGWEYYLSLSQD